MQPVVLGIGYLLGIDVLYRERKFMEKSTSVKDNEPKIPRTGEAKKTPEIVVWDPFTHIASPDAPDTFDEDIFPL